MISLLSEEAIAIIAHPRKLISILIEKAINQSDAGQSIHIISPSIIDISPVILLEFGLGVSATDMRMFRYMPWVSI